MRFPDWAGLGAALALLAAPPAAAQHHPVAQEDAAPEISPYAGLETRPVKALSDRQIADLRAGRGMGLALAAELNGYPGPAHTLELADALLLTAEQRARTQALFDEMKAAAIPIGERLIAEETALDRLFHDRLVTPASLEAATARIGETQGELRATHLRYHLAMAALLSPQQIARYRQLRGYAMPAHAAPGDAHHHAD